MRHTIALIFLLLAVGAVGVIVGRSVARPVPPPPREKLNVDAGLARIVDAVDFKAVAFEEVVKALSGKTGASIAARWDTLEAAGIDRNAPVSLRVSNLPLQRVLELLCDHVGGGTILLDVRETNGAIVITTADDASRYSEMRIYDIRDLVKENYDYRVRHGWRPTTQPSRSGGGSGSGLFSFASSTGDPDMVVEEEVTRMISEFVQPDMWREAGGTAANIRVFNGRVLVSATPGMHDEIAELLRLLREGK